MMNQTPITTLFLDIGGVLLTNGWGRDSRRKVAKELQLDFAEIDERHHLTFDTYEEGHLTLDDYLQRVIFYEKRPFTPQLFKQRMYAQSRPFPDMIALFSQLKAQHHLKVTAVSNEGRELTEYRIRQFNLKALFDLFIVSSFVHIRKPDMQIYQIRHHVPVAGQHRSGRQCDRAQEIRVCAHARIIQRTGPNFPLTPTSTGAIIGSVR